MKTRIHMLFSLMILSYVATSWGQIIQDPAALTAGTWEALPLVQQGQMVPNSKDTHYLRFKDVGMMTPTRSLGFNVPKLSNVYMTDDGMLVFWAGVERRRAMAEPVDTQTSKMLEDRSRTLEVAKRTGDKAEGYEWALFSIKDGQLAKICTDSVALPLPGEPKGFIRRVTSRIVPTKNKVLLYFDNSKNFSTNNGYVAWDGQKFSEFLRNDQTIMTSAGSFETKVIFDLDRTEDGNVSIVLRAKNTKGSQMMYWIHDGTTFSPILSAKDPWPGTQYEAKLGYLLTYRFVFPTGILLHADGGEFGGSILRIREGKTEPVLKWNTIMTLLGTKSVLFTNVYLSSAANPEVFTVTALMGQKGYGSYLHGNLIFHNQGKTEKIFDVVKAEGEKDKHFWINNGFFLNASPIAYVFLAGSSWREPYSAEYERLLQTHQLFSYDGATVTPLAKGIFIEPQSMRLLKTPGGSIVTCESKDKLQLVIVTTGKDGKKTLEGIGESGHEKGIVFLGNNGVTYQTSPKFGLTKPGPEIALTDVVRWINDREALAYCESGVYHLKRTE